ncbi:MAG: hypothetical protein RhofKO_26030 [Rhodothermales bacterium]
MPDSPKFYTKIPNFDLWTLEANLKIVAQHLDLVQRLWEQEVETRNKNFDSFVSERLDMSDQRDEHEAYIEYQELQYFIQARLPLLTFNPFIVTVWALFESSMKEVTSLFERRIQPGLSLKDIKGKSFLDRINKFYAHVLDVELTISTGDQVSLQRLCQLRNAIVHHSSVASHLGGVLRSHIEADLIAGCNFSNCNTYVVVEASYASASYDIVAKHLRNVFNIYDGMG